MSTPDLVELIKAIASAVSVIIGAVTIGYARISAKRAKQAVQQTQTTQHVDGLVKTRSSAETAEEALTKVDQLKVGQDGILARQLRLEVELGIRPGPGQHRDYNPEEHM